MRALAWAPSDGPRGVLGQGISWSSQHSPRRGTSAVHRALGERRKQQLEQPRSSSDLPRAVQASPLPIPGTLQHCLGRPPALGWVLLQLGSAGQEPCCGCHCDTGSSWALGGSVKPPVCCPPATKAPPALWVSGGEGTGAAPLPSILPHSGVGLCLCSHGCWLPCKVPSRFPAGARLGQRSPLPPCPPVTPSSSKPIKQQLPFLLVADSHG